MPVAAGFRGGQKGRVMKPACRAALFGGSFDPVHPGHIAVAQAAVAQADLDRVIFLPAARSPLKRQGPEASGPLRVEMLCAALAGMPWAEISGWELERKGASYSWQTVEHFQSTATEEGRPVEWFWLMGADQWEQLDRWKRWEQIAGAVTFLVFQRDGVTPSPRPGVRAVFLKGEFPGSSTALREARRTGGAWSEMLHPGVAAVVEREGLYSGDGEKAG